MSIWIEWVEPFGPSAKPMVCRVPVEAAIEVQKLRVKTVNPSFVYATDEMALEDFVTVRWAKRIEIPDPKL